MSDQVNTSVKKSKAGRKSLRAYIIGFVLSLLLTAGSFDLVKAHALPSAFIYVGLVILAIVQLFVQVTCFLRLNASKEGRWDLMPFIFTIFIVLVLVFGSVWIMLNLNYNMMH